MLYNELSTSGPSNLHMSNVDVFFISMLISGRRPISEFGGIRVPTRNSRSSDAPHLQFLRY